MTYDAHDDPQHHPVAYINPGEGPVDAGADGELLASLASEHLLIDTFGADAALWRVERDEELDDAGRFGFALTRDDPSYRVRISMPGLPIEQVRFIQSPDQNIWHYPRIFVRVPAAPAWPDSWVWCYCVDALREAYDDLFR
jgi:hypothetical protein